MSALPECPKCRGPSVPRFHHPDASDGEACEKLNGRGRGTAENLRCLACGWRFRGALDEALEALDATEEILRAADGRFLRVQALEEMGAAWRKRIAEDQAKFKRAMEGHW